MYIGLRSYNYLFSLRLSASSVRNRCVTHLLYGVTITNCNLYVFQVKCVYNFDIGIVEATLIDIINFKSNSPSNPKNN